jgi:protein-disulfide isomerase
MDEKKENLSKKELKEIKRLEKIEKKERFKKIKIYKKAALWISVIILFSATTFLIFKIVNKPDQNFTISVENIKEGDWVKGNKESKLYLIEYSDFQCPACASYYYLIKKLYEDLGEKITIVYRHFPLPIHKNAKIAAYAAEAAGKQEKFWEMHDIIFERQKEWENAKDAKQFFEQYAKDLNLNIEKFKEDMNSTEIKNKIEDSYKEAVIMGLNYTPTIFINGEKIQNPRNYEELKKIVEQKINEQN